MEPIVEITKQPDYKAYRKFYWFSAKFRPMAWVAWLIIASAPVYWIYNYGPEWMNKYHQENIIELSSLVVFVPFFIALVIFQLTTPRRLFRQYKKSQPLTTTTAFFEAQFTYSASSQNRSDSGCVGYENVNRVYETRDAFYLKYNDKYWSFYSKKFFAPGQAQALRDLFVRKFGNRFKTKY